MSDNYFNLLETHRLYREPSKRNKGNGGYKERLNGNPSTENIEASVNPPPPCACVRVTERVARERVNARLSVVRGAISKSIFARWSKKIDIDRSLPPSIYFRPLRLIPAPREFLANFCEFGRRIWYIHDWPSTYEYGDWIPWQSPCRRCCSGTAGSSPAPPERRDSSGVAANSTVGWRPARSPVNGTCTVVHLRSDIVRRIRISCGCARAYVNCVTVDDVVHVTAAYTLAIGKFASDMPRDFSKDYSEISNFSSLVERWKVIYIQSLLFIVKKLPLIILQKLLKTWKILDKRMTLHISMCYPYVIILVLFYYYSNQCKIFIFLSHLYRLLWLTCKSIILLTYRIFNINFVLAICATKIDEEIETSLMTRLSARQVCLSHSLGSLLKDKSYVEKTRLKGSELAGQWLSAFFRGFFFYTDMQQVSTSTSKSRKAGIKKAAFFSVPRARRRQWLGRNA